MNRMSIIQEEPRLSRKSKWTLIIGFALIFAILAAPAMVNAIERMSGAIFTTLVDGTRVNANIYADKNDVYLDGGPGPNAPQTAAGLPDGDYYFQVTDPSGKTLLSQDKVKYRKVTVVGGIIVSAYNHPTGDDVDHGAKTVKLMPYKNTPNNGGVYKVWLIPVEQFVGDVNKVDNPSYFHGFVPAWSKMDTFKVKGRVNPPTADVGKFYDANANGMWDAGEPELPLWLVNYTDPLGASNTYYTPFSLILSTGNNTFVEGMPVTGWAQTALIVDGAGQAVSQSVFLPIASTDSTNHTVVFGNVAYGYADFNTKGFWHNKNGLDLIQSSWITGANAMPMYAGNPFDGYDANGNPVPAAKNVAGETIAGAGTALAEISNYLVAPNAGGDPRIQLGQQFLAFYFNTMLNGVGVVQMPDGSFKLVTTLGAEANAAWQGSDDALANYYAGLFDGFNNNDAVPYVLPTPPAYSF